jgi:Leucine-rich repeat (LRR) protein
VASFDRLDRGSLGRSHFILVFPIRGDDRIPDLVERWLVEQAPAGSTHSLCVTGDFVSGQSFDALVASEATRLLRDRRCLPRIPPLLIDTPTSDEHLSDAIGKWVRSMLDAQVPVPVEEAPAIAPSVPLDRSREPSLRAICDLLPGPAQFALDDEGNCVLLSFDDGERYVRSLLVGLASRRVQRILGLVGDLGHLRHLGLPFARLRSVGEVPPSVRVLDVRGNQIGDASFLEHTPGIEALNVADCDLEGVPAGVQALPQLRTLVMAKNRMRRLPDWFSGLRTLRRVTVYRNQLPAVGSAVSGLPELRLLNLGANVLTFSHDELQDLPRLEALGLRLLGLRELPEAILRLPSLRHVDVSKNPITIPPGSGPLGIRFAQGMPAWRWDEAG